MTWGCKLVLVLKSLSEDVTHTVCLTETIPREYDMTTSHTIHITCAPNNKHKMHLSKSKWYKVQPLWIPEVYVQN